MLDFIAARILAHPHYPGIGEAEAAEIARMVNGVLGAIAAVVPAEARAEFQRRIETADTVMGHWLLEDANPYHPLWGPPNDFLRTVSRHYDQIRNGRSLHLELGPSMAWPDERKAERLAQDNLGDFIRLDMDATCPIDVKASVTALPFADDSIDFVYSNSLFEHCAFPHEILREAFRVLRPGGAILTKAPFQYVQHGYPSDYLRFTEQFFTDVCTAIGFETVHTESKSSSGIYYVTHQLIKAGIVADGHPLAPAGVRAHVALTILLGFLQGIDDVFQLHGNSLWQTTSALAIKPGRYVARLEAPDHGKPFVERYRDILICPASGLPLVDLGNQLASLDFAHRYGVTNGIPDLFVMHGFGSSFARTASSKEVLRQWRARRD
jgi:SAM-dependent methyltransferase